MSAKVEKQVSMPSGKSTTIQHHHHQQQSISNETTTQNSLDIINNKNSEKILTNNSNTNNNNNNNNNSNIESKDEVDFVRTKTYPPPTLIQQSKINNNNNNTIQQQQQQQLQKDSKSSSKIMNCEVKSSLKSSLSTLEKFSFFTLNRKHHNINQQQQQQQHQQQQYSTNNNNTVNLNNNNNNGSITTFDQTNGTFKTHLDKSSSNTQNPNNNNTTSTSSVKNKFVKSASIARLLGHTYNTKKIESELLKYKNNNEQQQQQQQQQQQITRNDNKLNKNTTICKSNDKLIKKNFGNISGNNNNHHNNNNQRCIERFQMCTNIQDELITNNNNNSNNSNQYASASYNNNNINKYNTNKNKTNHNETNQLSINNINNCNNCISQNLNNSNSNLNQINTKSHICNCNNNNHNNNSNNKINTINRNNEVNIQDFQDDHYNDISAKAFRTISRSIGKLWWKRTHSVEISAPDPEYKVSYLGNVLTGWAKGDGCVEKPLNTLWRNYTQNHKPDVIMRVRVCASGLKATTRQHGLTEYWSNRITHCCSPKNYSRVFCWIYRHEGRKLKHELRCHAILCSKESIAQEICNTLRENLDRALHDFKREKILKQNARLSLANSVYENPSLPRRKILLSVGGNNYRPPMERSKSAPKLMAIEEAIGEEDGEEIEQTNEPEMKSCCQKDSLYPAMTLGRRRCRRGHSIRRTGRAYKTSVSCDNPITAKECLENNTIKDLLGNQEHKDNDDQMESNLAYGRSNGNEFKEEEDDENSTKTKSTTSLVGSDDDDFEKLLHHNNYDTLSPLAGELLSYFDMKLNTKTSSLTDLCESLNNDDGTNQNYSDNCSSDLSNDQILYEASLTTDPSPRPRAAISLENLDNCSDGCEGDCGAHVDFDDEEDELYYRQTAILNLLHRNSLRKLANLSMSSDDSGDSIDKTNHHITDNDLKHQHHNIMMDSDEGSISSGCETASTVTANCEDSSLKYINDDKQHRTDIMTSDELSLSSNQNQNLCYTTLNDTNNQSNEQSLLNDNELNEIKISNKIMQFQTHINNHQKSPNFYKNNNNSTRTSITNINTTKYNENSNHHYHNHHHHHHHISKRNFSPKNNNGNNCNTNNNNGDVSDSEFSDESGYVEFQDQFIPKKKSQNNINTNTNNHHQHNDVSITTTTSTITSPSSTSSVILLQ